MADGVRAQRPPDAFLQARMYPSPVCLLNFDKGSEIMHLTYTISARLCRRSVLSFLVRVGVLCSICAVRCRAARQDFCMPVVLLLADQYSYYGTLSSALFTDLSPFVIHWWGRSWCVHRMGTPRQRRSTLS